MNISKNIFLALGLGILTGLFLGDLAAFFQVLAEIFVLLLQMTVLPYVTLSLIVGFGKLTYGDAKLLAVKGTLMLLIIWSMAIFALLLAPLAFPEWESASFFSTAAAESRQDMNYLEIFIPSNPFYSMSQNLVPAVVVFSICVGVALIGVEDKHHLIASFSVLKKALTRVTHFMVGLMPFGIFAIAASAAGTLQIAEFERLQVYLILYIVLSLLFTFWILPGLVSALTPIGYREIMLMTKEAMVTAFMTATLLVVLPLLVEDSKKLLHRHRLETDHTGPVLHAVIPTSFNFPHAGKVLAMSFILFTAWFTDNPLAFSDYPLFLVSGLASFFGSLNAAVPFLLDLLHFPADMFQLFVISSVLNARFGTLLAAMHTLTLGLLVTCAVTGNLVIKPRKLLGYTAATAVLTVMSIGGAKLFFAFGLSNDFDKDRILASMTLMNAPVA
ncbi:MAG: cation:dicarboxylate symporter family transporter, partial [Gammaproteobacteria bacterium]